MAQIEMQSVTAIVKDLERAAADFPQLRKEILREQAVLVEKELRASLQAEGLVDTRQLLNSLGRVSQRDRMIVGPSGDRKSKISRSGKIQNMRNGYVGYVHEYGANKRGIRARGWVTNAVKKSTSPAADIAARKINEHLKKNNL